MWGGSLVPHLRFWSLPLVPSSFMYVILSKIAHGLEVFGGASVYRPEG